MQVHITGQLAGLLEVRRVHREVVWCSCSQSSPDAPASTNLLGCWKLKEWGSAQWLWTQSFVCRTRLLGV